MPLCMSYKLYENDKCARKRCTFIAYLASQLLSCPSRPQRVSHPFLTVGNCYKSVNMDSALNNSVVDTNKQTNAFLRSAYIDAPTAWILRDTQQ